MLISKIQAAITGKLTGHPEIFKADNFRANFLNDCCHRIFYKPLFL